ncbi:MAG TPA: DUF4091 domain-containing protein [Clostridia bacterium]
MSLKKIVSYIIVLILAAGMFCSALACDSNKEIKIWSTYNTLKVLREGAKYPDLGQSLDVFMAKNETEGAQLIVTPKQKIKSITLEASDLKTEDGVVFSKDNITVYFQKYIYVKTKTKGQTNYKYPVGYTPDMLLPMDLAQKYKENSVPAGKNQGFTVEFKTTLDTPAGDYYGKFILKADGQTFEIPVHLEVLDIALTKVNGKTCIVALSTRLMSGEYNNTPEHYRKYYETAMNEYKFNFDFLPGSLNPEEMAESAIYYWDNPNFTSFAIPVTSFNNFNSSQRDYKIAVKGKLYSYLYTLCEKSEPGRILLDKAYIYPVYLDEPQPPDFDAVGKNTLAIYEVEDLVFADLEKNGYFDKYDEDYKAQIERAIKNIPIVITANLNQMSVLGSAVNTYCPQIDQFHTPADRLKFQEMRQKTASRGGETWFYICMIPLYPYPTLHIDDNLLGGRVMRWMQKDYDLEGFLHWSFNSYHSWNFVDTVNVDPYEEPTRFPETVGDGYMFYPGKKYGVDTFLPSIRLTNFRDGQEDYDMLCLLDSIIEEKEEFFGLPKGSASSRLFVQNLYEMLYTGTIYNEDDAVFYQARRMLVDTILKNRSDTKFLISSNIIGGSAVSDIYLANGYDLTVNGQRLTPEGASGQGVKYTITQTLDKEAKLDITISQNGQTVETYNIFVANKTNVIPLSQSVSPLYVSATSQIVYENDTAVITLKSKGDNLNELLTFTPLVGMNSSAMSVKLDEVDTIRFTLTNTMSKALELKARLKAGYYTYDLGTFTFEAGESKTIAIEKLYQYKSVFSGLADAVFELASDNADADKNLLPDRHFVISNLNYSIKREGA